MGGFQTNSPPPPQSRFENRHVPPHISTHRKPPSAPPWLSLSRISFQKLPELLFQAFYKQLHFTLIHHYCLAYYPTHFPLPIPHQLKRQSYVYTLFPPAQLTPFYFSIFECVFFSGHTQIQFDGLTPPTLVLFYFLVFP